MRMIQRMLNRASFDSVIGEVASSALFPYFCVRIFAPKLVT